MVEVRDVVISGGESAEGVVHAAIVRPHDGTDLLALSDASACAGRLREPCA